MWLLIAEAFIAGGMLVFIVWWTMSSRRRPDSPPPNQAAATSPGVHGVAPELPAPSAGHAKRAADETPKA